MICINRDITSNQLEDHSPKQKMTDTILNLFCSTIGKASTALFSIPASISMAYGLGILVVIA